MQTYENKKPLFAFSFHGELSHDSINLIGNADNDVTEWLQNLQRNGLLDNTILILMSDHGNRYAPHVQNKNYLYAQNEYTKNCPLLFLDLQKYETHCRANLKSVYHSSALFFPINSKNGSPSNTPTSVRISIA